MPLKSRLIASHLLAHFKYELSLSSWRRKRQTSLGFDKSHVHPNILKAFCPARFFSTPREREREISPSSNSKFQRDEVVRSRISFHARRSLTPTCLFAELMTRVFGNQSRTKEFRPQLWTQTLCKRSAVFRLSERGSLWITRGQTGQNRPRRVERIMFSLRWRKLRRIIIDNIRINGIGRNTRRYRINKTGELV